MSAMRGPRLQVGSAAWVAEERSSALQIVESEVEEFSYSARNEMEWLNEHMAGIFDENETNFAETFKTPGKLRGKTPRTARKPANVEGRVPLSNIFASTPNAPASHRSQYLKGVKSPHVRRDVAPNSPEVVRSPSPRKAVASPKPKGPTQDTQDSGYYGSQDLVQGTQSFRGAHGFDPTPIVDRIELQNTTPILAKLSSTHANTRDSPEKTFQTAKEEQTTRNLAQDVGIASQSDATQVTSPASHSRESSPMPQPSDKGEEQEVVAVEYDAGQEDSDLADNQHSASESSSPIRPIRKSSLNFASLPAREPLAAVKAHGGRISRVSHLDHNMTSYYSRPTGGKSLGNVTVHDDDEAAEDQVALDSQLTATAQTNYESLAANHHKTYTQRLQDQISMLGKSQAHHERQSKSVSDGIGGPKPAANTHQAAEMPKSPSPFPTNLKSTPGAFPEDEDDWIEPPAVQYDANAVASPRPALPKSHSADIMESLHETAVAAQPVHLISSPQRQTVHETQMRLDHLPDSLLEAPAPTSPSLQTQTLPLHKAATVADLRMGASGAIDAPHSAPKSPTRSYRDSPLKHVKNKLSSILKSSKGLIANGAVLSAEAKSSILSPSTTRLGHFAGPSMETLAEKSAGTMKQLEPPASPTVQEFSPSRPVGKRTRSSTEREKEDKKREKETKRMEQEYEKLEKARAKEREKARDFSKGKEATEKPGLRSWKDASLAQKTPKATRSSPRKPREADESAAKPTEPDVEMTDAPSTIPQLAPRSAGPASALRNRELKRPIKPVKEPLVKSRPAVIRVNTGSHYTQYPNPASTSSTAAGEADAPIPAAPVSQLQQQLTSKASKASLQSKPSTQSLRAAATASAGRPKALDAVARKKEQDEREAQRRREAKAELERKRTAALDEQRKNEQLKRQEADRQKQKEREQLTQAEAKKNAHRQAAIEKAKQTRAPPPAVRSHNHGPPDVLGQDPRPSVFGTSTGEAPRPPSRMTSGFRTQDEAGRLTTTHAPKAGAKRALPTESTEVSYKSGPSRTGLAYQAKDAKRARTSEDFDDRYDAENPPNIKGAPMRPSNAYKKDNPTKPGFPTNYPNPAQSATRDQPRFTATGQHPSQAKTAHPLDMAQISKGAIPFATPASTATGHPTKTPIRSAALNSMKASAAKSTAKQSPKFQNGEAIELPEIQTDDEDDENDDDRGMVAAWADSPALRIALMNQEVQDPSQIFGPPRPLNMEEVFFKSKEKFHSFRSRTSSANWTGPDRLTEDDIRKDRIARDKLRREGGWTHEMSRNLL